MHLNDTFQTLYRDSRSVLMVFISFFSVNFFLITSIVAYHYTVVVSALDSPFDAVVQCSASLFAFLFLLVYRSREDVCSLYVLL